MRRTSPEHLEHCLRVGSVTRADPQQHTAAGELGIEKRCLIVGQFAPEVIEDLAKIERGFAQSLESVSWKKYVQLAKEYASEPVIENEIQKAIAKAAERLMMGGANI